MERREFLKLMSAIIGISALPKLTFSREQERKVIFDSGYLPGQGRMKIYSDMTWERELWLGLGGIETGIIENNEFIVLHREQKQMINGK